MMRQAGCLIVCLLALGAFGAYSYPQEDQPEVGKGYEHEGDASYNDESSERVKRDERRMAPIKHRPQRILQAAENTRIEGMAHRLMEIIRYYENHLRLTHQHAVNRALAENPDAAYQVLMHAARNVPY